MKESILNLISNTPLVRLRGQKFSCPVYAKLEDRNPGGSVKDRTALAMVEFAERKGWLKPGGTIVEASSGNQGIALAMIGAVKGYKVIITASEKVSREKKADRGERRASPPRSDSLNSYRTWDWQNRCNM